ncbi:MAG: hypothetical protein OXG27_00970 [Chloroflexi bacterium]|nr:hypothetical protein [Chloroflexota bacterium]
MSLLDRLPWRRSDAGVSAREAEQLSHAEALLRAGAAVGEIRRQAASAGRHNEVERAWAAVLVGDLDAALRHGYAAASERPYDVDSRIVHGTVRLARNELEHAQHEFEAVIEEFGAESDAMDGKRAVILAQGFAPLDELPASDDDWAAAARLLTTLWRLAECVDVRLGDLASGHADGLAMIRGALAAGRSSDLESDHGEFDHGTV